MPASSLLARIIEIVTPKKVVLSGLLLGPRRPQVLYIFVHGLAGSLFSRHEISTKLVDRRSGVLLFNNRGSGLVNGLKIQGRLGATYSSSLAGQAHEIFQDCLDDLDGALKLALATGARRIFLVGHSTGCQKSVYYLSYRPRSPIKGAILLAPVSDYSTIISQIGRLEYHRLLNVAKRWQKTGRGQESLIAAGWNRPLSAQRFLSLYDPSSAEELFGYASGRSPRLLRRIKRPLFLLLAGNDKYHDRPAQDIAAWFEQSLSDRLADIKIIVGAGHDFSPHSSRVARLIKTWADSIT